MANNQHLATRPAAVAGAGLTVTDDAAKSMMAQAGAAPAVILPQSIGDVMEFSRLMSMTKVVPPHLRGNQGDCMAVVMQAMRWGLDPFAVASKSFFVNDRIAYESQLINAVVYARAPLEGRLQIEYSDGPRGEPSCKVTGYIKGDPNPLVVEQDMSSITTRNSPLWKQSPKQQLAYYTTRLWARLYVPDVLLGVYAPDELMDPDEEYRGPDRAKNVTPRPERSDFAPVKLASVPTADEPHDPETGEIIENEQPPAAEPESDDLDPAAVEAALNGTDAFRGWWAGRTKAENEPLKAQLDRLKAVAAQADEFSAGGDSPTDYAPVEDDAPAADEREDAPLEDEALLFTGPADSAADAPPAARGITGFVARVGKLANVGAIEHTIAENRTWINGLSGFDKAQVNRAIEDARARAKK